MDEKQIIHEYSSGISRTNLCAKYKISWNKLTLLLKNDGINLRTVKDNSKKYICNEDFFETIDNEEKAYWLGFIYADGWVTKNKLSIRLSETDASHLDKFKNSLNSNHPIHLYNCTNGFSVVGNKSANISITSEKMVKDLLNIGVFNKKSLILKFPNFLQKELVRHFIRGYFDGDGSISLCFYSRKKGEIKKYIKGVMNICGTYEMLSVMKTYLPCNFGLYKEKRNKTNTWNLKTSSLLKTSLINEYFYNDSIMFLDRKKNKFNEIINRYERKYDIK